MLVCAWCCSALPPAAAICLWLPPFPSAPQVFNVCTSPMVQQAWDAGQALAVHGLVYALTDGILKVWLTGRQAGRWWSVCTSFRC